jgi:hypothetical protein
MVRATIHLTRAHRWPDLMNFKPGSSPVGAMGYLAAMPPNALFSAGGRGDPRSALRQSVWTRLRILSRKVLSFL